LALSRTVFEIQICGKFVSSDSEDLVILACTVLTVAECDGQTDRATDTHSKTDASTTAKMRKALHTVSRKKNYVPF